MNWQQPITGQEIIFSILFLALYFGFIFRTWRLARKLGTPAGYVSLKLILRSLYFSLLIVGLLGPSFGKMKQEVRAVGKDTFICLDLSESMNAFDISPSRLLKVKFELLNMIDAMEGDRIGLIVFSDQAFVNCPLTFDHSALRIFIETLNTNVLQGGSTDLGAGMNLALKKFAATSDEETNARAIILISDGEDFYDNYGDEVAEAKKSGVKVFTLGVGTEEGSPIPVGTNRFKLDEDGRQVVSRLNSSDLQQIANKTGGQYYELSQNRNGFPALTRDIQAMEGEVMEVKAVDIAANKFTWPLAIAAILIFLDIMVPVRLLRLKG